MAGFTDNMRGVGGTSPVDRYLQGLKIGIEMEQDDEMSVLRQAQANKINEELKRKRRTAAPDFNRHVLTVQDPNISPDSPAFKEAASQVQAAGLDVWNDAIQGRNQMSLVADRMKADRDDEMLTQNMANAIGSVTGQDLSGAVGQVTRKEGMALGKEAGIGQRAERTAGQRDVQLDINAQNAATAKLRAESQADMNAASVRLKDVQLAELDNVNRQGGFKTVESFGDWAEPYFLNILTNGRVARKGAEVPESAIAQLASAAAWRRISEQGMTVGDAIADVSRQFDIKPTKRKQLRPNERTQVGPLLEESKKPGEKKVSDEALADALRKALGLDEEEAPEEE